MRRLIPNFLAAIVRFPLHSSKALLINKASFDLNLKNCFEYLLIHSYECFPEDCLHQAYHHGITLSCVRCNYAVHECYPAMILLYYFHASSEIPLISLLLSLANSAMNFSTRTGMSSRRSRKGGNFILTTSRR